MKIYMGEIVRWPGEAGASLDIKFGGNEFADRMGNWID